MGNFGTRGAVPTHPELLDYLALQMIDSGWSTKHIQRLIVNSNTYRQAAVRRQLLAEHDLELELTPAAKALIGSEGNDPHYGARPLKRAVQRLLENPLAKALLEGKFKPGSTITADADPVSGTIVVTGSAGETYVSEPTERRDPRSATGEPTLADCDIANP